MITILIRDKNGKELSNGDTIRSVTIRPEYQEEYDPFMRFQNGTIVEWSESSIDLQEELEQFGYCGIGHSEDFTKERLLELFDLPSNCNKDEYKECVYDVICEELDIRPKNELEFFEIINGFEIIDSNYGNP